MTAFRCRRFVAATLLMITLAPAPPDARTRAEDAPAQADRIYREALPSVFLVETESWTGPGFLVDPSGLILTAPAAAECELYLSVTVAPGKRFPAHLIGVSGGGALIRIHPAAVTGVRPLPLAGDSEAEGPPAVGDRLVGILRSPHGGFVPTTGVIEKVTKKTLYADMPFPAELGSGTAYSSGSAKRLDGTGLLLDTRGRVVGLEPVREMKRHPRTRIPRIQPAEEFLSTARAEAERTPPPSPEPLPVAPLEPYPGEALERLTSAGRDPGLYQALAGPFLVEFLTPPLAHALTTGRVSRGDSGAQAACAEPDGDRNRWRPGFSDETPVVYVRVVPEIRARPGIVAGVAAYWLLYPAVLLFALVARAPEALAGPPRVSWQFHPAIREIEIRRGGRRMEPIRPSRLCGFSGSLMEIDLCPPESRKREKRRVKGCYFVSTFPYETFSPGEPVELRILREGEGDAGAVVLPLSDALVQRIWSDFQPYREAFGSR